MNDERMEMVKLLQEAHMNGIESGITFGRHMERMEHKSRETVTKWHQWDRLVEEWQEAEQFGDGMGEVGCRHVLVYGDLDDRDRKRDALIAVAIMAGMPE